MKTCLLILIGLLLAERNLHAELESLMTYEVVSDTLDTNIPEGKFILEGEFVRPSGQLSEMEIHVTPSGKNTFSTRDKQFQYLLADSTSYVLFQCNPFLDAAFENYDVRSQHRIRVKIYFYEVIYDKDKIYLEKPVIYGYSEKALAVEIKLKTKGELTFSYPLLPSNNTWNMSLKDGVFLESKEQAYPYLFWESELPKDWSLLTKQQTLLGAFIARERVITYLDSTLTLMGLNSKEKTDFITHWGPQLVRKPFCFVQFLVQEDCEQFASYQIEPKPDYFNRLYMVFDLFTTIPTDLPIQKQVLAPFERSGFYMIEWGGFNIDLYEKLRLPILTQIK